MVVEEGLNQLPYQVASMLCCLPLERELSAQEIEVTTPTGCQYFGLQYEKGNCGVSIGRSVVEIQNIWFHQVFQVRGSNGKSAPGLLSFDEDWEDPHRL